MNPRSISQTEIKEQWFLVDAAGQRIGKLGSIIAEILMGKHNPLVREYLDPKAYVVVINASKLDITPKRAFTKHYTSYSGFPGGLRVDNLGKQILRKPEFPIENAVKGMLPKTKKGSVMISRLKVFSDDNHAHTAQTPVVIDLKSYKL